MWLFLAPGAPLGMNGVPVHTQRGPFLISCSSPAKMRAFGKDACKQSIVLTDVSAGPSGNAPATMNGHVLREPLFFLGWMNPAKVL